MTHIHPLDNADYVRTPVRFFAFMIPEQGTLWLDDNCTVMGVEQVDGRWHVTVMETGDPQQRAGSICEGCGHPYRPEEHVYGVSKCCPDCTHTDGQMPRCEECNGPLAPDGSHESEWADCSRSQCQYPQHPDGSISSGEAASG